jgi:hypothetical protein
MLAVTKGVIGVWLMQSLHCRHFSIDDFIVLPSTTYYLLSHRIIIFCLCAVVLNLQNGDNNDDEWNDDGGDVSLT